MKTQTFWYVTPCLQVNTYPRFRTGIAPSSLETRSAESGNYTFVFASLHGLNFWKIWIIIRSSNLRNLFVYNLG